MGWTCMQRGPGRAISHIWARSSGRRLGKRRKDVSGLVEVLEVSFSGAWRVQFCIFSSMEGSHRLLASHTLCHLAKIGETMVEMRDIN